MKKASSIKYNKKTGNAAGTGNPPSSSPKLAQKGNFLKEAFGFRWLKKALMGKGRDQELDLLDQWILKKRALSFLFD